MPVYPDDNRGTDVKLPIDQNSNAIQVLTPLESITSIDMTATTATSAITGHTTAHAQVVEVAALDDCHVAFGDNTITASVAGSAAFPKGVAYYRIRKDQTHVAALLAAGATAGRLTVRIMN